MSIETTPYDIKTMMSNNDYKNIDRKFSAALGPGKFLVDLASGRLIANAVDSAVSTAIGGLGGGVKLIGYSVYGVSDTAKFQNTKIDAVVAAGKFALYSALIGTPALALVPSLVFSIFAYLEEQDKMEDEVRHKQLADSIIEKLQKCIEKADLKQMARREFEDACHAKCDDVDNRDDVLVVKLNGTLVSIQSVTRTRYYLDKVRPDVTELPERLDMVTLSEFYSIYRQDIDAAWQKRDQFSESMRKTGESNIAAFWGVPEQGSGVNTVRTSNPKSSPQKV